MTAADWSAEMARLRSVKPRALAKLYGERGPTPEQAADHATKMRAWNSAYRRASKEQRAALEASKAAWAAASEEERADVVNRLTRRKAEPIVETEDSC